MESIQERIQRKSHKDMLPYVYYDKEIMPFEEAGVSIAANTLHYGGLVFGGLRGYVYEDGRVGIFRLDAHFERLMNAAKIMAFDFHMEYEAFKAIVHELIRKNAPKGKFYIRPFIFCDESRVGPKLEGLHFDLAIYMQNLDNYRKTTAGIRFLTSSFPKYNDASISTKAKVGGAYVNSMMATHQAHLAGFDEALLLNHEGYLAEASVANALIVYRDKVMVPPLSSGALEGITLRSVLELLDYNNIPVEQTNIDRSTLYVCDELIITGTAMQVGYGAEVDGRVMKYSKEPGPITRCVQEEMEKVIALEHPFSERWMVMFD